MKLNLLKFSTEILKSFNPEVKSSTNWFKVSYINRKGNNPKPFVFPNILDVDELVAEAMGLYIGDGTMNVRDKNHVSFINIDADVVKFIFDFFRSRFKIKNSDITFLISYSKSRPKYLKEKWSTVLNIPKEKFKTRKSERNKNESVLIQINGRIFSIIFKNLIIKLLPVIQKNNTLRKGFLRGFFASDGGIAVKKDPRRLNLVQINFNYNPKTEIWLRNYILKCLNLEEIENINYIENETEGYITVYNWKNYLKFWKIKLFDRNKRKKSKFLNIIKDMCVYIDIEKSYREKIFSKLNLTQNQIAQILNSWQANVSRTIAGIHLLKIEQVNSLIEHSNLSWDNILQNSNKIRIGNNTDLDVDEEFLKFVLTEKNLI